ncbi:MAG: hypothetical protein LBL21_02385 [Rickettsiales bacterium]|jgi:hypothetical protein|nr:hypothetical protein [Rickettsiales bacterium]
MSEEDYFERLEDLPKMVWSSIAHHQKGTALAAAAERHIDDWLANTPRALFVDDARQK